MMSDDFDFLERALLGYQAQRELLEQAVLEAERATQALHRPEGRIVSEQTRQRISATQKRIWAEKKQRAKGYRGL